MAKGAQGALRLPDRVNHASLTGTGRSEAREEAVAVVDVKRYWPGRAPTWAEGGGVAAPLPADQERGLAPPAEPRITPGGTETRAPPRQPQRARVLESAVEGRDRQGLHGDTAMQEEEEDADQRRAKARARILERRGQDGKVEARGDDLDDLPDDDPFGGGDEFGLGGGDDGREPESGDESEESDSEEEDSDEATGQQVLLKPIFVRKDARKTAVFEEEVVDEEEQNGKFEARRKETLDMVVESVRSQELEADSSLLADPALPDDGDGEDEAGEYERWKLRELRRVKAERDARTAREREAVSSSDHPARWSCPHMCARPEQERKSDTDDEGDGREEEKPKEPPRRKFLQKYYHKGAFFQAEDASGEPLLGDVMKRDFGEVRDPPACRCAACC